MGHTVQTPNPAVDSWLAATELAQRLDRGMQPPVISSPLRLRSGEVGHAHLPATTQWYGGVDVTYPENTLLAFGGITMLVITATASAILNRRRRNQAAAEAAPQWRPTASHSVAVTNHRILLEGPTATSIWHPTIQQLRPNFLEQRVDITAEGHPPYRIHGPWTPYVAILVHHLLHPSRR